jgi:hypothetical protein
MMRKRERLNCFPIDISSEDIITFFTLTPVDKKQIPLTTNASNRLGFALQLCTLRYLGFCPDILTPIPAEVLGYLAKKLGVDPNGLSDYGERAHTRTDHLQAIDLPVVMEKKTTLREISARKHCNRSRFLSVRKETGMILCFILFTKRSWK